MTMVIAALLSGKRLSENRGSILGIERLFRSSKISKKVLSEESEYRSEITQHQGSSVLDNPTNFDLRVKFPLSLKETPQNGTCTIMFTISVLRDLEPPSDEVLSASPLLLQNVS